MTHTDSSKKTQLYGGGRCRASRCIELDVGFDMLRRIIRRRLGIALLIMLALEVSASQGRQQAERQDSALDSPLLSDDDKAELSEVARLQKALGDQVWPGFGRASIPLILYNNRYEFLIGTTDPPAPWAVVESDYFNGEKYYRRNATNPQAFAVHVDDRWAGSMSTLGRMNRKSPLKLSRDFHVVAVLHEMFHAYQSSQSPERFNQARKVYAAEARYPFKEAEFAAAWDREGYLLATALKTTDDAGIRRAVRDFLQVRDARRARAALSADLLAYERELEWLEGLAKYIEIRFYELASSRGGDSAYSSYRPGLPYWQTNFVLLERQLARQGGDLRFYLSGMAQARLLDGLSPGWKEKVMRSGVYLEDILRTSVGRDAK